jgi:hypothetical protein
MIDDEEETVSSEAGMPGSHAANQSKTESMPPTEGHGDPEAAPAPTTVEPPELDTMSVNVNDPQAPRAPGAGGDPDRGHSGVPATEARPTAQTDPMATDVDRSAANTNPIGTPGTDAGPGDTAGVPVPSHEPAPGSSEDSAVAQGSRTPEQEGFA